jgi:hypothetical protein
VQIEADIAAAVNHRTLRLLARPLKSRRASKNGAAIADRVVLHNR